MKVTFLDGTIKECSSPTEQKRFKSGEAVGWMLSFDLIGNMTSDEVDNMISAVNISNLTFAAPNENGTETTFVLTGYERVLSAFIRYMDDDGKTRVELHLAKDVEV